MLPVVAMLLEQGLSVLGNAVLAKGKEVVEDKLGVKLPDRQKPLEPEQVVRLKELEAQHEQWLIEANIRQREQELESEKLAYADLGSARDREVKIATSKAAPTLNKIITPVLAIGVLVLTFGLFAVVLFGGGEVDGNRKDLVIYILGVLSAISTQVVAYYFGSSRGSATKDNTIRALGGTK